MALVLSLQCFLANLRYQSLFGVHLLEATILLLELLHPFHERGIHAAKFRAPFVKRRLTHTVLAAQIGNFGTAFILFEDRQGLAARIF